MIKWFKRRRLEKRIFLTKGHQYEFVRFCATARVEGIVRQISRLKQAILNKEKAEIRNRQRFIRDYGITPPKSLNQCDKLIGDLRKWRDM